MIEETFFLFPPEWLTDPPDPAATKLFKTYARNAPPGTWPANTSTHQGLYTMTADGGYLSGSFARASNSNARNTLTRGLEAWEDVVAENDYDPEPVPTDPLDLYGGEPLRKGGLKLEVVYRDLPRGDDERPGDARFPNPYNLGWFDFTPDEARGLLAKRGEQGRLPDAAFRRFASQRLKDSVRGQMSDWKDGEIRGGELVSRLVGRRGSVRTYELTGSAELGGGELGYAPTFYGRASFDTARGEFTDFRLVAHGQRTGKGRFNGRETDLGPAPLGVGFRLYEPAPRD